MNLSHRRDIDGLRALAVLPVLLFHAAIPGFEGGYVGVDVFFVISGYLISRIIVREVDGGDFSLLRFYERRARRILPALLVVVLATLLAGALLLLPNRFEDLGESALAALAFFANVHFYNDTGYFDDEATLKPLLHTWSLAVEEQYYLVIPLLLLLVSARWRAALLLLLLAASLAASAWLVERDPAGAFFLPHTRVWELLLGALAGSGILRPPGGGAARAAFGIVGLAALLAAIFTFDQSIPFPGLAALLPCLGTLLLLLAGDGGPPSPASRLLSYRPLVAVGLVSYSLYLWHWPILVLLPRVVQRAPTTLDLGVALLLCLLLSVASWRFVEQPFRRAAAPRRPASLWRLAALGAVVLAAALTVTISEGLPQRLPAEARAFIAVKKERNRLRMACLNSGPALDAKACRLGAPDSPPALLLVGDSHAAVLGQGIDAFAGETGLGGFALLESGCPPALGLRRRHTPTGDDCRELEAMIRDRLDSPGLRAVILHARWPMYVEGTRVGEELGPPVTLAGEDNPTALAEGMDRLLAELAARGLVTVLVASVPEAGVDVPTVLAHRSLLGNPEPLWLERAAVDARQARTWELLRTLAERHGALLLDPRDLLCDDARCRVVEDGEALYFDDDHLSAAGVRRLRPLFEPLAAALAR